MPDEPTILVVEDNSTIQKLVSLFAKHMGVQCISVWSCGEAIEKLKTLGSGVHAVFMDWTLPDDDGLQCTRWIRELEATSGRHLPIIAMTAKLMPGDREQCLEAGMDDFLGKPFTMNEFHTMLRKWVVAENLVNFPPGGISTPGAEANHKFGTSADAG